MDCNKLVDIFKGTIDPNQRENAEQQLEQVHKIIGFTPSVLQVVMNQNVEMPVRQAAAIYMKNNVIAYWAERESDGPRVEYSIHEQDRSTIRNMIIDACVHAPEMIAVHMAVCINHIIKHDFPVRWFGVIEKTCAYLQMPDKSLWNGAFMAIYQLVKNYEYKSGDERKPLDDSMNILLPILYQRLASLVRDNSETSILIQKQILKIFYAFIQYSMSLRLLTREVFTQWMECFRLVVERPVPPSVNEIDIEERANSCYWKCKKWALHILTRVFDRYGNPGNVQREYKEFADWYIKTFSSGIINVLLKILEQQGHKIYVAPRVIQQTLNYFNTAVHHSFTWKIIKDHMITMIQTIIFPLMCYTDEDHELWTSDPQEYIRLKFDVFEDYVSPVTAAQTLLHTLCKKRKDMLKSALGFVVEVMNDRASDPRMKDGALHMVGSVADILLKKENYKEQIELMLVTHVFPYFRSEYGYLRARSCWVLHYFGDTRFQNESYLLQALQCIQDCLLKDSELPVKVEAAICLQVLVGSQEKIQKVMEASISDIATELLNIIRDTENEDLTNVMQKLVCMYPEQLVPKAVHMTQHLALTFSQIIESNTDEDNEDKALTAMGVLNTIDTILTMMEDQTEVVKQLEPIVIKLVEDIFTSEQMDLYEEALTLMCTISTNYVSQELWRVFALMYRVFKKDGFDYFTDMMPALHNFVTVDPAAFLANPDHIAALYDMCKSILNSEAGEEAECHAAKLMECMILQFKGQIDQCIHPFVELALSRLARGVKTSELRTMCLQVVIAALYYNPELLFQILDKMPFPNSNQSLFAHFMSQWINDTQCFIGLHDRKMCVIGIITLMTLPAEKRPAIINELAAEIVPSALLLFDGLKQAYQSKANAENQDSSDSEDEEGENDDIEDLDDDEDNMPPGTSYFRGLMKKANNNSPFPLRSQIEDIEEDDEEEDEETDEEEDEFEQTALESYTTPLDDDDSPIDEYVTFKEVLETIQQTDSNWYNLLMSKLSSQQHKTLHDVYVLAVQRKAAAESRKIEKSGGYMFTNQSVPSTFNFGGTPIA